MSFASNENLSLTVRIRAGLVKPWVGEGAAGCRRSAAICADELDTLAADDDERREPLKRQRQAWLDRAAFLEEDDG